MLLFNMLVGPVFSAGSITNERERQTLDLLLTTSLSPWQILSGKIYSSLRISVVLTRFLVWPLLLAWLLPPWTYWADTLTMLIYLLIAGLGNALPEELGQAVGVVSSELQAAATAADDHARAGRKAPSLRSPRRPLDAPPVQDRRAPKFHGHHVVVADPVPEERQGTERNRQPIPLVRDGQVLHREAQHGDHECRRQEDGRGFRLGPCHPGDVGHQRRQRKQRDVPGGPLRVAVRLQLRIVHRSMPGGSTVGIGRTKARPGHDLPPPVPHSSAGLL